MMIQKYKVGPGRSRVFFLRFETTRTIIIVAIVGTKMVAEPPSWHGVPSWGR